MEVSVVRGGGIGGVVVTTSLDSVALDADAAVALGHLVDACPFDGADRPPTGRADGVRVELSVVDGGRRRLRFDEHDAPEGAHALAAWVLDHPAARRSVGRRPW